jgi:5,10-methylenetetrahydrofolate reductase
MTEPAPHPDCPKHMHYGPCAGLRGETECELPGVTCPFVGLERPPAWTGATPTGAITARGGLEFLDKMARRPVFVTDIPTVPLDAGSIQAIADQIGDSADAVLIGDHGGARVQFPPAYRAMLMRQAGLESWVGFNCRDRNRVALESEAAALAHLGVAGVNVVTGDHPQSGHRADAKPVFDLDSTRLASLARAAGLLVSVGENPISPPLHLRAERLAHKVRAGAHLCFVNLPHCVDLVLEFRDAVRAFGVDVPFIVGVPVITSRGAAEQMMGFQGLRLPDGYLQRILLARDPRREGIRASVEHAQAMLEVPGVRGLNLSGPAAPGEELNMAADFAEVARALRSG